MSLRIAVTGGAGRMGCALIREVAAAEDLVLAAALEDPSAPAVGQDSGILAGVGQNEVLISSDVTAALDNADVVIDFSSPAATATLATLAAERGVRVVIGTTGLDQNQRAAIEAAAKNVGIVFAPNTSIAVNVLFHLAGQAARLLGTDYQIEVIEAHHRHKKDAPSGTALRLAEILARETAGVGTLDNRLRNGRSGLAPRTDHEIGVHAIRGGDIVGEHTVMFCGEGERLELTIRSATRQTYTGGAARAARWVSQKPAGLYDMHEVLGIK